MYCLQYDYNEMQMYILFFAGWGIFSPLPLSLFFPSSSSVVLFFTYMFSYSSHSGPLELLNPH